jgi:hypothetical protein
VLAKDSSLLEADLCTTGITVEEHELEEEQNCTVVIASNILLHREMLQTAVSALADGACILAREKPETQSTFSSDFKLKIVFEKTLKDEKLLLLRKVRAPLIISVSNLNQKFYCVYHKSLSLFHILSHSPVAVLPL